MNDTPKTNRIDDDEPLDPDTTQQLRRAFDPGDRLEHLHDRLASLIHENDAADGVETKPLTTTLPNRTQLVRPWLGWAAVAAASIAIVVTVSSLLNSVQNQPSIARALDVVSPSVVYHREVEAGLMPSWVCSAEEFASRVSGHFGDLPIALAPLPAQLELLGWTEPYYSGAQTLNPRELILLTRYEGKPVIVLLSDKKSAARLEEDVQPGLYIHRAETKNYIAVEVSPLPTPVFVPLLGD